MKKTLLLFVLSTVAFSFMINAQIPTRTGWWKFDDASNLVKAELGSSFLLSGSGLSVDGPTADNKAIQIGLGSYLEMTHGISANGGGAMANEYTLQIDFSIPETGIYHAFFQTDPTNGDDADLFINKTNAIGVSSTGYTAKAVEINTWYRLVVTVKNSEFFRVYIDGTLWKDASAQDIDGRFGLASKLLMFADDDGDDGTINCSEIGIWDTALDADQVLELGGAKGVRVPVRTKLGWWKFDDASDLLKAEIGNPLELTGTQTAVAGPSEGNNATMIGLGSFLKMTDGLEANGGGTLVNEYSLQIDFAIPETGNWYSFFQTDPTNTSDAELFVKKSDGTIGTLATTYSTNSVNANDWYRMVITVKNGEFFKVYVNGELWIDGAGQDVDGRYALADKLLLFADNDGDDGAIICSEVAIWEVALTENEVLGLGTDPYQKLPERMGWWKFDDSNDLTKAEIGYPLMPTGSISAANGPAAGNNAVEVGLGSYLNMTHQIYGNGGGYLVNDYTLQIDFSVLQLETWYAFFQTEVANGGDADLFVNKNTAAIGTAQTSYSENTIEANTWYRLVVSVKNDEFFRVYLNGEIWIDAAGQGVDGRFALDNALLIFADNDGDDGDIFCSELAIWDVPFNGEQVAKLGNPTTIPTGIKELQMSQNNSDLGQNYPNPFSLSTTFPYQITDSGNVSFRVIDITGRLVKEINVGNRTPGKYNLDLPSEKLNNGIYYLQMKANDRTSIRKMIIAR